MGSKQIQRTLNNAADLRRKRGQYHEHAFCFNTLNEAKFRQIPSDSPRFRVVPTLLKGRTWRHPPFVNGD
jgi:hypothetical protein